MCSYSSKNYDVKIELCNTSLFQNGQRKVSANYYAVARRAYEDMLLNSSPVAAEGFGGLSPPKQSSKLSQIEICITINQ